MGNLTRRHALTGAATVGLGLPLLAACGGGSGGAADPTPGGSGSTGSTGSTKKSSGGGGRADAFTSTSDIPVGGGTIFADQQVVITQPTQGDFKGFSAICTHQGCTVSSVTDGKINCPCHGSQFSITDGSNVTGPGGTAAGSIAPLAEVQLSVKGSSINLA
jgi:Rieske Fe-S protein